MTEEGTESWKKLQERRGEVAEEILSGIDPDTGAYTPPDWRRVEKLREYRCPDSVIAREVDIPIFKVDEYRRRAGYDTAVFQGKYRRIETRFWKDVDVGEGTEEECWEWTGATSGGYGRFSHMGKEIRAHRFSWELFNGVPIPSSDLLVRHTCHNSLCVNPHHLLLGDHMDNANDKVEAGRAPWQD